MLSTSVLASVKWHFNAFFSHQRFVTLKINLYSEITTGLYIFLIVFYFLLQGNWTWWLHTFCPWWLRRIYHLIKFLPPGFYSRWLTMHWLFCWRNTPFPAMRPKPNRKTCFPEFHKYMIDYSKGWIYFLCTPVGTTYKQWLYHRAQLGVSQFSAHCRLLYLMALWDLGSRFISLPLLSWILIPKSPCQAGDECEEFPF